MGALSERLHFFELLGLKFVSRDDVQKVPLILWLCCLMYHEKKIWSQMPDLSYQDVQIPCVLAIERMSRFDDKTMQ